VILDEYDKDKNHLDWVNLCANMFVPGSTIARETDYNLILVDPLYTLNVKNFDLAILRIENASLILVDCKHSVSDPDSLIEEINGAVKATFKNKSLLEKIIGNRIADMEFVVVVPALDAPQIHQIAVEKNYPICVWGLDFWKNELRLMGVDTETEREILSGRAHKDKKLNRLLFNGIKSNKGVIRPITIMPSSHMCTILVQISEIMSLGLRTTPMHTDFSYSDAYNVLRKEMGKITSLTDEECTSLCERTIATAVRKGIFHDLTEDTQELNRKVFQFTAKPRAIARNTENNYVQKNARKLAEKNVVERFRRESGFRNLRDF
jgi:hypothetical protein